MDRQTSASLILDSISVLIAVYKPLIRLFLKKTSDSYGGFGRL